MAKVSVNPKDRLLTAGDVAAWLRVSKRTVWTLASSGRLPSVRISRRCTRFRESDVLRLVARGA